MGANKSFLSNSKLCNFFFVIKLLVLLCEKTKRSGDSFTIGMECQDCLFVWLVGCLFVRHEIACVAL